MDLMQLPSLKPERARALYSANLVSVEEVSKTSIQDIVKAFSSNEGFTSHALKNTEDLNIRYEFLYNLSSKLKQEANLIISKRTAVSSDQEDLPDNFKPGQKCHSKFMIDSDDDSD